MTNRNPIRIGIFWGTELSLYIFHLFVNKIRIQLEI